LEAAEERLRQRFAILYEAEDSTSNSQRNALTLPSIEQQFDTKERPNKIDMWTYRNKNYLMYTPSGVEFTQEEKVEMAKRKMEIEHNNTRLAANPFNDNKNKEVISEAAKSNARGNPEKIGVDGKTMEQEMPTIRGFSFVQTPSPAPSIAHDSSPLMMWGEIEGTPFRLDASDTPLRTTSVGGPSFRINEMSKREALGLQLAESVSEKHRAKKMKAIEAAKKSMCATPRVRNSMDRLSSMSPAARRLSSMSRRDNSWATPSPRRTPKTTPLVKVHTPARSTSAPKQPEIIQPTQYQTTSESTLTDNLLDIPSKRSRAADFF
jgi:protein DGCR14